MSEGIEPPNRYDAREYQRSIGAAREALEGIMKLSEESKDEAKQLCANITMAMSSIEKMRGDEQTEAARLVADFAQNFAAAYSHVYNADDKGYVNSLRADGRYKDWETDRQGLRSFMAEFIFGDGGHDCCP